MSLSKTERRVIANVIAKLEGKNLDPAKAHHLEALRLWLDTWVIPPLQIVADPNRKRYDLNTAVGLSE